MAGIDVKGYGVAEPGFQQEAVEQPDEGENVHRRLILEHGRIQGAIFVGPPGTGRHIAAAIEGERDLTPIKDRLKRGEWEALAEL
jgi:NAD(P)H-nitrite reductase large subunit